MNDPSSKGHVTYNRNPIPRHYVATLISVIHSPSPISISSLSLSLSLSLLHTVIESMALRLPTQLATPGKFHHLHHHSKTSVSRALSWKRTIAPDAVHFSPLSSSTSTSTLYFLSSLLTPFHQTSCEFFFCLLFDDVCLNIREMQCGAEGDVHGGDSRGSEPSSGDPGEANEHTGGWGDGNSRKAGGEACSR